MNELGQLIFTGISGITLTEEEKDFIEDENIGGVILFKENFESPAQLAELVNSIQVLRREYPLFIAVDHEGGRVIRFKSQFTQFPSMLEVSKLDSPKICFEVHKIMAQELAACGINLNMSPVCDVFSNPSNKVIGDRAFGVDEESVSKYVSSAVRGLQTNGVLACAKHFPGHGNTTKDSHLDLPYVKTEMDMLEKRELPPFTKAVKSRVEFLMMAHLVVDAIDPDLPCSLSEKAHKFAREYLRYNRIIISDDMQMGAITDHFGVEEAAVKAIAAGTDVIEYRDMEYAQRALEALKKASADNKLDKEALQKKVKLVESTKKAHLSEYNPIYIPGIAKVVGSKQSEVFLEDIKKRIDQLNQS